MSLFLYYISYFGRLLRLPFSKYHAHNQWLSRDSIRLFNQVNSLLMVYSQFIISKRSTYGHGIERIRHVLNVWFTIRRKLHHLPTLGRQISILGPVLILCLQRRQEFHQRNTKWRFSHVLPFPSRQRSDPPGCVPRRIQNGHWKPLLSR